ncbi:MAG: hypothetical protein V1798_07990 [Pseudomonadota bacterium]
MKSLLLAVGTLACSLSIGCGGVGLPLPEKELQDIVARLGAGDAADDATLAPDVVRLNEILLEAFNGAYQPIPEDQLVPFDVSKPQNYTAIDAFRWGFGLTAYATVPESVGALVARPVSANYSTLFPLMVTGNWAVVLSPTNFRSYERVFADGADQQLIAGSTDRAEAVNHVVNLAPKGIVFQYDSDVVLRRVRDANLPSGEALLYWEQIAAPAVNLTGNYNAYLTFLRNFQITIPFTDKLSWEFISAWSVSGGSVFIFSAGVSSGDIGAGIRNDFVDLESYLTAQGLSCGTHCT